MKAPTGSITLNASGSSGFIGRNIEPRDIFLPGGVRATATTPGSNTITTAAPHGWSTGRQIKFSSSGAGVPAISGITNGRIYFAINVNTTTLKLATSAANALAGVAVTIGSTISSTYSTSYSLTIAEGVSSSSLSDDDKVALASAEAGDVTVTYQNRNGIVGTVYTVIQRDDMDIFSPTSFSTNVTNQCFTCINTCTHTNWWSAASN